MRPAFMAGRICLRIPTGTLPVMSSAPSGLDMSDIARLVDRFYERVRVDPEIGPVFNAAVHDWDAHKRLLTSFWSSIALRAGTYRGNPMAAHQALPINAGHFTRWLALWRETCAQELEAEHATQLIGHAERIGRSLAYGLGIGDETRHPGLRIVGITPG